MSDILSQLGIDWKLFLSQLINFALILIVLTLFVYKPVLKIIKQRNAKIKEGLDKAEEANVRLKEVDEIGKQKIKEAENTSINIIKTTEKKAKDLEQEAIKRRRRISFSGVSGGRREDRDDGGEYSRANLQGVIPRVLFHRYFA